MKHGFRVWDNTKGRYVGDDNDLYFFINPTGKLEIYSSKDGGKDGLWEHAVNHRSGDYITEASTSLPDKNGKIMFEWDRVIIASGWTGVVKFERWAFFVTSDDGNYIALTPIMAEASEVIGTIHDEATNAKA